MAREVARPEPYALPPGLIIAAANERMDAAMTPALSTGARLAALGDLYDGTRLLK